ncbi:MAG: HAMP domain-containing sensor histidine kinase [Pseudanabaenaceae cyanobacterium bins.68]|nr:HAMP domain-containing sensor histidine kinase [Pseudanabaenaceae cyanobacterium bins.68]
MSLLWFTLGIAVTILLLCGFWVSRIFSPNFSLKPKPAKRRSKITSRRAINHPKPLSYTATGWQNILNLAPIGYLEVDADNRLYWCNQKLQELLSLNNWPDHAREPKLLLQLVRSYELDQLIEQTRQQRRSLVKEWIFRRVNPDPLFPTPTADLPLRGHSLWLENHHIGIYIQNYTQEFLLTQQRDRWTSDLAHELKTPLTSIRLLAETLQYKLERSEREWIDRLLKEVLRLSNLVEDLLDLSRLEGDLTLNAVRFDLAQTIHEAWQTLEPQAQRKKVRLVYEGSEQAEIQGDQSRIYRLMLNLLDNAIKHSPNLQIILVKLNYSDRWQLEVIDSGEGFPPESLPYEFERFYRKDRSRSRTSLEQGGSGLGLAIVAQIIKAHHGEIHISNHPETNGAWIKVFLP